VVACQPSKLKRAGSIPAAAPKTRRLILHPLRHAIAPPSALVTVLSQIPAAAWTARHAPTKAGGITGVSQEDRMTADSQALNAKNRRIWGRCGACSPLCSPIAGSLATWRR
jgi:hypothetical protein